MLTSPQSRSTGKERDSETGLDYFGARYYGSNMGRFMTPDWASVPTPVPYADLANPQSLNLYSYVTNNPMNRVDPLGHNWFKIDNKWEWHKGKSYTDANGNKFTSNFTHLLKIEKTGQRTRDGGSVVNLTLYGNGPKLIQQSQGFTGGTGHMTTPDGNYVINLNVRGGPSSNRVVMQDGYPTLGAFPGIQRVVDGGNAEWGTMRANLNKESDDGSLSPTHFYLHGKFLDKSWTHGCTAERSEMVLDSIFNLNRSQVGDYEEKGHLPVWVH